MDDNKVPAYTLRVALPTDVDWLVDLRERTMNGYIEASGHALSAGGSRQRVLQDFAHIRVLVLNGQDMGMVKLLRHVNPWKLVQIQIETNAQNTGLGTWVMRDILAEARLAEASVALSVLKVNPARRLYERLGFRVTEEKSASYEMLASPRAIETM